MGLITQKTNYSIAGGDTIFSAVQLEKTTAAIQVQYSGINANDAELYLEQSPDGVNFNIVPGGNITIDPTKPSHLFNVNIMPGLFIRVGLKIGSTTTGSIDIIQYLI